MSIEDTENNPIQLLINKMNEQMRIKEGKEYNLGNLLKDLEPYKDKFLKVEYDDGSIPGEFMSWRGRYNCLALDYYYPTEHIDYITSTNAFYNIVKNILNTELEGYKGGIFKMDENTPIFKANYGESDAIRFNEIGTVKIIGIKEQDNKIILVTKLIKED